MATPALEPQTVRRHLDRALASENFARSERLSRFLRFVVEQHLAGRDGELKESVIAMEVFGNRDYDPRQDSIVRTEAGRLRARLAEYYDGAGSGEPVIFELPKGGYVPVFRQTQQAPVPPPVPVVTRSGRSLWPIFAAAGLALALGAAIWLWFQTKSAPIAIAVLPLQNLNQDPATDYFADGLTDEVIRNLSIIDGLAVRSQTSSFSFKGKARNVHDVGKQLTADYILEGSVLRSGQHLRIDAQLVRVRDDVTLWSNQYDRELTDVFAIQNDISQGIVNSLRLKLGRGRRKYETSVEAYDFYLRARAVEMADLTPLSGSDRSVEYYQQAIAKDPSFAPAYAGLTIAYAYRSGTNRGVATDDISKMRASAEKAIQLDPLSGEAHSAFGVSSARYGQWAQAEKSIRRAIELDPNNPMSYLYYASYVLMPLGRLEEARHQLQIAEKADPLSPQIHGMAIYVLLPLRRFDEADGHCAKSSNRQGCLGKVRLAQGRLDEAIQLLGGSAAPLDHSYLGYALGRAGRREEAERIAQGLAGNPFQEALIDVGLGDKDRAFEALGRMIPLGPVRVGRALNYAEFASLRGDPRLKGLRKKAGLPD